MSEYSQIISDMDPGFSAQAVREQLDGDLVDRRDRSPALAAYLGCYGLNAMADACDYGAARLQLAGAELVVQHFRRRGESRGTVLMVHGYMDHAGLTRPLLEYLFAKGWDLLVYDLPGHGLSAGAPHAVEDFFHYADQLAALIRHLQPQLRPPLTLVGHSTGCAIICTALLRDAALVGTLTRPVLLAPLVRPTHLRGIRRKYRYLRFLLRRVRRFQQSNSHDREFLDFIRNHDPLQHAWIPVRWIGAMLTWIDWIERQSASTLSPLMIQGTADGTVEWRHNMRVLQRLFPQSTQVLIDGGRHNLVNEGRRWRIQVFESLLRLLEQESLAFEASDRSKDGAKDGGERVNAPAADAEGAFRG